MDINVPVTCHHNYKTQMSLFIKYFTVLVKENIPKAKSAFTIMVVKSAWANRHENVLSSWAETEFRFGVRIAVVRLVLNGRMVSVSAKFATNIRERRRVEF